jgi:hypothetical protein
MPLKITAGPQPSALMSKLRDVGPTSSEPNPEELESKRKVLIEHVDVPAARNALYWANLNRRGGTISGMNYRELDRSCKFLLAANEYSLAMRAEGALASIDALLGRKPGADRQSAAKELSEAELGIVADTKRFKLINEELDAIRADEKKGLMSLSATGRAPEVHTDLVLGDDEDEDGPPPDPIKKAAFDESWVLASDFVSRFSALLLREVGRDEHGHVDNMKYLEKARELFGEHKEAGA